MIRVALTGGIASGKSLVASHFERLGVPVVDADEVARVVVRPGTPGLGAVVQAFGSDVLDNSGALDRAILRRRIFDDRGARERLEAILHPRIRAHMEAEMRDLSAAGHVYGVCVIPLLVETGQARSYDRVLVVDAPEAVQRERLQRRDGATDEAARSMLASQTDRWSRLQAATDVVANGDAVAPERAIAGPVLALDRKYRALATATQQGRLNH